MPIGQGPPSGDPHTSPQDQNLIAQQTEAAHNLVDVQQSSIDSLQQALAKGDINQNQYFTAVGKMYDARLAQLQGDLVEQGRPGAAAAVPVGIGTSDKPPSAFAPGNEQTGGAFAPPEGVQFTTPNTKPRGSLDETGQLLAGPTDRPHEPVTAGASGNRVPPEVIRALPALLAAAQQPDASPALQALLRLVDYYINGQ